MTCVTHRTPCHANDHKLFSKTLSRKAKAIPGRCIYLKHRSLVKCSAYLEPLWPNLQNILLVMKSIAVKYRSSHPRTNCENLLFVNKNIFSSSTSSILPLRNEPLAATLILKAVKNKEKPFLSNELYNYIWYFLYFINLH